MCCPPAHLLAEAKVVEAKAIETIPAKQTSTTMRRRWTEAVTPHRSILVVHPGMKGHKTLASACSTSYDWAAGSAEDSAEYGVNRSCTPQVLLHAVNGRIHSSSMQCVLGVAILVK